MAIITLKLLLEKGLPKSTTKLKDIKTLNLSKMQLKTEDLDVKLISQMKSLEELNLSGNLLSDFPSGISLPNLKVLNCADNQLEDVTLFEHLRTLEELNYEGNLYMTTSDDYKIMCLLPNLQRLNGKEITSSANHVRFVNGRELTNRVSAHWDQNYKSRFPKKLSAARVVSVGKEFIKSAVMNVKYGPNSLRDFTKWRVKIIAEKLLESFSNPGDTVGADQEDAEKNKNAKISPKAVKSPRKRKDMEVLLESPSKRRQQHESTAASPTSLCSLRNSQRKCALSPIRPNDCKKESKDTPKKKKNAIPEKGKQTLKLHESQQVLDLEPLHFLQCHSKDNHPKDFSTQLWSCAFEPSLDCSSDKGPRSCGTVATCGGESVCVIDCESGRVLKKYKVSGEEFFTLAWTSLTMVSSDGQKRNFNVLAAAGRRGVVKLIHVKANFCYGEIKAHKKPISAICFSSTQATFLFTGSYDKRIVLWDIGVPDVEYNFKVSQLLTLETDSTPLRMTPVPSCPDDYLLAACEKGCFAWDIKLNKQQERRSWEVEFQFPVYAKEDKENYFHLVDGLAFLNEDIVASKSATQGSIYLWNWSQSLKMKRNKCSKVDAHILAELEWSNTELPYLMLSSCPGKDYVFCGDENGSVWMYDVSLCKTKGYTKKITAPTQVLKWPFVSSVGQENVAGTLINSVAVDPSLAYLVYTTDKNIVGIWKIN